MDKYLDLLKTLYGNSFSSILSVLNESVYVTDFSSDKPLMHTGFSFSLHTGTKLDILFCPITNTIVRSPKTQSQVPQLIGLVVGKNEDSHFTKIFESYIPVAVQPYQIYIIKDLEKYLSKKPEQIVLFKDDKTEEIIVESFKIEDEDNKIHEFPLNKHLAKTVFYGQSTFQEYTPNFFHRKYPEKHSDHYSDYSEGDAFYDATDGQLDDLGDFGWTFLGRD